MSDCFDISKSLLHDFMRRVVVALNSLADRFIKWPVGNRLRGHSKILKKSNFLRLNNASES